MNKDEIGLLLELVNKAFAEELMDSILVKAGPTDGMKALKRLETKLLVMKGEVT